MRTKVLAMAVAFVLGSTAISAQEAVQDTTWKTGGLFGANLSQVSLTNWAAGGFSSISGNANLNLFANMKKGKNSWDNTLDLGYGLLKQGDDGDVQKTDDRIDFASKYGREAWSPHWYYSALLNFKTQFTEGEDADGNVISDLMAPGYLLGALGLDYKPNDNFSLFISPLTAKFTFVQDEFLAAAGAYGVDAGVLSIDTLGNITIDQKGASSRSEFGGYAKLAYTKALMENVQFLTTADFFSNYEVDPQHIDVNWDVLINMKVNEYITTTLGTTIRYDHDVKLTDSDGKTGARTQFRQIFGVGFSYAL